MAKKKESQLIEDLIQYNATSDPAFKDMKEALIGIANRYKLHPAAVLAMLARISVSYIEAVQMFYDKQNADVVVKDDFMTLLTAGFAYFSDISEVNDELEKRQNGNLN